MVLLGPDGGPISSGLVNKKAPPPRLGENSFGAWAGRDLDFVQLPGGGVVQFDLSKLELADFRQMRDHYQVNSSLAVLSFMQHQSDWHIECEDQKIADLCESQLRDVWTTLNRAMSTANWAGYSPNVLDWDNDSLSKSIKLMKVRDLVPEECEVNWKLVDGWAPPGRPKPKHKVYDGIKQYGYPYPAPVENSFWYPLLMENGDYYGKKLLRPAFTSWFFSILVHLFANRYYERFGEPVPIGRAPFDEEIDVAGKRMAGTDYMLRLLQDLRSRSVVVLPNDRAQGVDGKESFDYDIEYLESQMRGADFERYLTRLDEEISIGLFTPILLLRTADVGSYNLGVGHMQMYLWMLNAMNDDRAQYLNKYILRKMTNYNFSEKAPSPKIVFRKLGNSNNELLREVLVALVNSGKVKPDIEELGSLTGMSLTEIKETVEDPADGEEPPGASGGSGPAAPPGGGSSANRVPSAVMSEVVARVRPQVEKAFREGTFGPDMKLSMGYKRRFVQEIKALGLADATAVVEKLYADMDLWTADLITVPLEEYGSPNEFMDLFQRGLNLQVGEALSAS